jgi:pyruvate,water dikinase
VNLHEKKLRKLKNKGNGDTMIGKKIASGTPASEGVAEGSIKVLHDLSEIGKVSEGDIIVVKYSNPAWTLALLKASGIIAETGGIICHSAIVAREMGIPCIVGVDKATELFKDNQKVVVNGTEGVVYETG